MEKTSGAKHLGYLDGLRGLAAVFVVLHHAYLQVVDGAVLSGPGKYLFGPLYFGRYAVDLFIVLSGFCLMLPIAKGDGRLRGGAVQFFQRRAWRILPTYYLALLLSWILATFVVHQKTGTHWDFSLPVTFKSLWTHLLLVHDALNEGATINHVFWSIAVEWRIYFLFPLLVWAWRRFGGVTTTFVATFSSYGLFLWLRKFQDQGLTAYYIGLFAMGMLGASLVFSTQGFEKWKNLPWGWLTLIMTAVVIVVSKLKFWHGNILPEHLRDELLGMWAMCLLVSIAGDEEGSLSRWLSLKPLKWLGTFAYSIYLIHAPLLQVFWQFIFVPLQRKPLPMLLALILVATPLIIGLSYGFFLLCERPFLRRKAASQSATQAV